MRVPLAFVFFVSMPSLAAQGEEDVLPFVDANEAFASAAKEGKRVFVYQDWPT